MKRHMKMALQFEYMNEDNANNLWVAPSERFSNIHNFPNIEARWNNICFTITLKEL
ncbi:hypothetical protein RchiOBHm_Chr2g0172031 [Rosa chinensis]|uniref:Uncharacterized protein n=1 Tax=Rosa chinensis TaxID=74649 RepID=A0A2P6S5J2_ROSCH|nr:hypothetical protein RchiOBHm_Chr2g0172031 [Rosa chinensis]